MPAALMCLVGAVGLGILAVGFMSGLFITRFDSGAGMAVQLVLMMFAILCSTVCLGAMIFAMSGLWLLAGVQTEDSSATPQRWSIRLGSVVAVLTFWVALTMDEAIGVWARPLQFISFGVFLVSFTAVASLLAAHLERIKPIGVQQKRPRAGTVRPFGPGMAMSIVGLGTVCGIVATLIESASESDSAEWLYAPLGFACIMSLIVANSLLHEASALRRRLRSGSLA